MAAAERRLEQAREARDEVPGQALDPDELDALLDEAAAGDEDAAASRLAALAEAAVIEVTEDAILLAEKLIAGGGLPVQARVDALHVAMAAVHGMDYLLTWNCRHIANATLRGKIEELCREAGFEPPTICTPLELPKE